MGNVSFPLLPEKYSHMTWDAWDRGVGLVLVLQRGDRTQQTQEPSFVILFLQVREATEEGIYN